MSLAKGDHVVIKRNGLILTPDNGEVYHEFEVVEFPQHDGERSSREWAESGSNPSMPPNTYYNVVLRVVR